MSKKIFQVTLAAAWAAFLICASILGWGSAPPKNLPNAKPVENWRADASLVAAVTEARYGFERSDGGNLHAENPANRMRARFYEDGALQLSDSLGNSNLDAVWRLKSIGRGDEQTAIGGGEWSYTGVRAELRRASFGLTEYFENRPDGLEQGFILREKPEENSGGENLRLVIAASGAMNLHPTADNQAVELIAADGAVLRYEKLKVWDTNGAILAAAMRVEANNVLLDVEDAEAVYPITIDPTFARTTKFVANDGAANDFFGASTDVDGDTMVVGSYKDDINANADRGSAYVYTRSGTNWTLQQKLTANDGAADDRFGIGVAISGNTIIVGAGGDDIGGNANQGSAYVFTRSGVTWTQTAKITASDGAAGDEFGTSAAIDGNTAVIGAAADDVNGNTNQGSAYALIRSGANWTEQAKFSLGTFHVRFGIDVDIDGNTILVSAEGNGGAFTTGIAAIYFRTGTTWTQQASFTGNGGSSAIGALHGDTAVVYGAGGTKVYVRNGTTWTEQAQLTLGIYYPLAINGNTIVAQNSVYIRSGTTWTRQQRLSVRENSNLFSVSYSNIAIDGETIVVGEGLDNVGANEYQGSVSVFQAASGVGAEQPILASDGAAGDSFGASVAIDGDTAIVGVPSDDFISSINQGSAYIFVRNGSSWTQQAKIFAGDGGANDNFGNSVAIDGDTVVVGARQANVFGVSNAGAAYVFARSGTNWTQQAKLTNDVQANDTFGSSVAISQDRIIVGAPLEDRGAVVNQGAAYIFEKSSTGTSWSREIKLLASDGAAGDQFGASVSIEIRTVLGGTYGAVIVGAPFDTISANEFQGSAYLFNLNFDWEQVRRLTFGGAGDNFGDSVAVADGFILIGASSDDVNALANQGTVYSYQLDGNDVVSLFPQPIRASDGAANARFGSSVAVSNGVAVVGSPFSTIGANTSQGAAYVFFRQGSAWVENRKLFVAGGSASDTFGESVAISGSTILAGIDADDIGGNANQGSVAFYELQFDFAPTSAPVVFKSFSPSSINVGGVSTLTLTLTNPSVNSVALTGVAITDAFPAGLQVDAVPGATNTCSGTFTAAANANSIGLSSASIPVNGSCAVTVKVTATTAGDKVNTTGAVTSTNGGTGSTATATLTVNQTAACTYLLNPTGTSLAPAATSGNTFSVNTQTGCGWTAISDANWITIRSGSSGTGSGAVTYSVTVNTGAARTGTITAGGQTFTVNQAGSSSTAGLQYYPLAYPIRLLDTRSGAAACYAPGEGFTGYETIKTQPAQVSCQGLTIPTTAQAIVGTATVMNTPAQGNLRLYPTGEQLAEVSNVNFAPGRTVSNSFTVKLGTGGAFNIYSYSPSDVIIDVTGYYAPPGTGGLYYHQLPKPIRILETRPEYNCADCGYQRTGVPLSANSVRLQQAHLSYLGVTIPASARAITGNATVVNNVTNSATGKIKLYPGDMPDSTVTESINYAAGQVVPNAFTVRLDSAGQFKIHTSAQTHVLIDVTGYYSTEPAADQNGNAGLLFNILSRPFRLLDTRSGFQACDAPGVKLTAQGIRVQTVRERVCSGQTIPAQAKAIFGNATVVNNFTGAGVGNIRLYPGEEALANASNLNYVPGETNPNSFIVGLGATRGEMNIYSYASTDLIIDVSGYFAAPTP